ncbi:MAG: apolipoprotein N-acyltransferase, partial [Candidatus Marinamargulisbacteria bacterium]
SQFQLLLDCILLPHSLHHLSRKIRNGKKTGTSVFFQSALFGFVFMACFHIFFLTLTPWAHPLLIGGLWLGYSLILSLYYGVIGWAYVRLRKHSNHILLLPSLWTIGEWLRSLGQFGNTSGILGYSQSLNLPVLQSASIWGVFGISFILVLINVLIFRTANRTLPKPLKPLIKDAINPIPVLCILLISLYGFGIFQLQKKVRQPLQEEITVSIVQGNHNQATKLDPKRWAAIRNDYVSLTRETLAKESSDIVFWPETITPAFNLSNGLFKSIIDNLLTQFPDTHLVFGTPYIYRKKIRNAVASIKGSRKKTHVYLKTRLMPFGEYFPGKSWLNRTPIKRYLPKNDFHPGSKVFPLLLDGTSVGTGICLESIYPGFFRSQTRQGAEFLAVLANNAWFFQSSAAERHFQMSVLRAVENNRYLVQVANTGISAIISNAGVIISKSDLNSQQVMTQKIPLEKAISIFSGIGYYIPVATAILVLLWIGLTHLKQRKR